MSIVANLAGEAKWLPSITVVTKDITVIEICVQFRKFAEVLNDSGQCVVVLFLIVLEGDEGIHAVIASFQF